MPRGGGSSSRESIVHSKAGEGDRVAVSPPEYSGGVSAAKRLRDFAARLSDSEEEDESSGSGRRLIDWEFRISWKRNLGI